MEGGVNWNKEELAILNRPSNTRFTTWIKSAYNITEVEYNQILKKQRKKCAICKHLFNKKIDRFKPCIDHDHKTQKVRGIVCNKCNQALGCFYDNIKNIERALHYLKHSINQQSAAK